MLNNLSNIQAIINDGMVRKQFNNLDVFVFGARDNNYDGNYRPAAITAADLQAALGGASGPITMVGVQFQNQDQTLVLLKVDDVNGKSAYEITLSGDFYQMQWNSSLSRWEILEDGMVLYWNATNSPEPPTNAVWQGVPIANLLIQTITYATVGDALASIWNYIEMLANQLNQLDNAVIPQQVYRTLASTTATIGSLIVDEVYTITTYVAGDDFSIGTQVISGVMNTTGCVFSLDDAIGVNPVWANGSTLTNQGNRILQVGEVSDRPGYIKDIITIPASKIITMFSLGGVDLLPNVGSNSYYEGELILKYRDQGTNYTYAGSFDIIAYGSNLLNIAGSFITAGGNKVVSIPLMPQGTIFTGPTGSYKLSVAALADPTGGNGTITVVIYSKEVVLIQ